MAVVVAVAVAVAAGAKMSVKAVNEVFAAVVVVNEPLGFGGLSSVPINLFGVVP